MGFAKFGTYNGKVTPFDKNEVLRIAKVAVNPIPAKCFNDEKAGYWLVKFLPNIQRPKGQAATYCKECMAELPKDFWQGKFWG